MRLARVSLTGYVCLWLRSLSAPAAPPGDECVGKCRVGSQAPGEASGEGLSPLLTLSWGGLRELAGAPPFLPVGSQPGTGLHVLASPRQTQPASVYLSTHNILEISIFKFNTLTL